jgi:IclR family pca regulon transcriptional regulator
VLLSALAPEELRQRLAAVTLERYTPVTTTDAAEIARILAETRACGYSIVDQELEVGLRSIGVPIVNRGGDLVAAMSISLIEGQLSRRAIVERYLEPLKAASREITEALPH